MPAAAEVKTLALLVLVFGPMLAEAGRSRRNERVLRAQGAVEPAGDVYAMMQVAYPACFLALIGEGWVRGSDRWVVAGAVLFAGAKALKYWAIATLGARWTFRVLVPPAAVRIDSGPYRWLRHPNYVGVAGEIAGVAMMAGALFTGVGSLALFGALMLARIAVEERAMDACER